MAQRIKTKHKKDPTCIIIVRHGETALNAEKRIRGWSDVPLDDKGRKSAHKTGRKLRGEIDRIVSSDLDRAQETASIIAKETGLKVSKATKSFRPWHVGNFTGEPDEEVYPIIADFARHHQNESLEGGESFRQFKERFIDGVYELLNEYPGERIALVTHHRGDRLFHAWKAAGFPEDYKLDMDTFLTRGIEPGDAASPAEIE